MSKADNPPQSTSKSATSQIYEGLSGVGKVAVSIELICAAVIAVILIITGIYFLSTNEENKFIRVKGAVTESTCNQITSYDTGKPVINYNCNIVVSYTIEQKIYYKSLVVLDPTYTKNAPIDLMVDKNNYENVQLASINKINTALILFIIAPVIFGLAYLHYWLTYKYQPIAALHGIGTGVRLLSH